MLAPVHGRVELAGDVAVSQAMIPAIVRSQLGSLLLAVAGNLLIVSLLFRSLRAGLACIAPSAVAVAWTFGVMGWLGIPLGVATSMFCAVTLGIGVDYGIHFFERFQQFANGGSLRPGLAAGAAAGPSILIDSAGDLARLRPAGVLPGPRRPPPRAARRPRPVERLPAHAHHLGTPARGAPPPAGPARRALAPATAEEMPMRP